MLSAVWLGAMRDGVPMRGVAWGRPHVADVAPDWSCTGDCREHDDGVIAQGFHSFRRHVACPLHSPFVILFQKDCTDQLGDGSLVWEDADDVGTALDFAVKAFDGVVAAELCAVLFCEGHVGEQIPFRLVHYGCQSGYFGPDLVGDGPPLLAWGLGRFLRDGGGDEGRDDPATALSGMSQGIAHEVHAAALPRRAQQLRHRSLDALMRVRDNKRGAAPAPAGVLADEACPEGPPLRPLCLCPEPPAYRRC